MLPVVSRLSERHGKLVDPSAFQRDILPLIQAIPLSQLRQTPVLSLRYVSLIRRGERTPHPRHWEALLAVAGFHNHEVTERRLTADNRKSVMRRRGYVGP